MRASCEASSCNQRSVEVTSPETPRNFDLNLYEEKLLIGICVRFFRESYAILFVQICFETEIYWHILSENVVECFRGLSMTVGSERQWIFVERPVAGASYRTHRSHAIISSAMRILRGMSSTASYFLFKLHKQIAPFIVPSRQADRY